MSRFVPIVINVLAFNTLWTLSMFAAGRSWWWIAPVLVACSAALQLRLSPLPGREALVMVVGAIVGLGADRLAVALGIFSYRGAMSLEFFILFLGLWINFGTTLRPSLSWAWRKPAVAILFGLFGGPMAYFIGSRIGAIELSESLLRSLGWVAMQYAVILPIWMMFASRVMPVPVEAGPRPSSPGGTQTEGTQAS